jgi:hypothetical protein
MPADRPARRQPRNSALRRARRAADRHYLAVVAAEARRLAGQLRPESAGRSRIGRALPAEISAEVSR